MTTGASTEQSSPLTSISCWASFLFALLYLIAEYMRPQQMYDELAAIPLGQIAILGLLISVILEGRSRFNTNRLNALVVLYLIWFGVSYADAVRQELALQAFIDFSKWVVIYFLLINTINARQKLYFFLLLLILLNFKYAQYATRLWISAGFYSDPRGLNAGGGIGASFFQNPNDFGIAMTSVLGLAYAMIKGDTSKWFGVLKGCWFHIISAVAIFLAILASSSRGAALGAAATAFAIWAKGNKKIIGLATLAALSMMAVALIPEDNWQRFRTMGTEHDESGQSRLALWSAGIRMALENPLTGVGPNNFVYVNTQIYQSVYAVVQHNVFIQAASELGLPGLLLFIAMIITAFRNNRATRQALANRGISDNFLIATSHGLDFCLFAFCVNGMFITVLYYPFVWILFIVGVSLRDIAEQTAARVE